jgi:transposase
MSPTTGILSILCANRQPNHELSETIRALIVSTVETGSSYRDVATAAKCSLGSVHYILQRWKTQRTLDKKPRSGRPKKPTAQQIRYVLI